MFENIHVKCSICSAMNDPIFRGKLRMRRKKHGHTVKSWAIERG